MRLQAARGGASPRFPRLRRRGREALTRCAATQLAAYQPGDPVEVLYEEGWCARTTRRCEKTRPSQPLCVRPVRWEGYVAEAHDGRVVLRFDSNPGEEMTARAPRRAQTQRRMAF